MGSVIGFHSQEGIGGTLSSLEKILGQDSDWSSLGQVPGLYQSMSLGRGRGPCKILVSIGWCYIPGGIGVS